MLVLIVFFCTIRELVSCPGQCDCSSNDVICSGGNLLSKNLREFATKLPKDTKTLDLSRNQLESFDACYFSVLKRLSAINLNGNSLVEFPKNLSKCLPGLVKLRLSDNLISRLDALDSCHTLQHLEINNNSLTNFNERVLKNCSGLRDISLNDNQIEILSPGVFRGLEEVRFVRLSGNRLVNVTNGTFDGLKKLHSVFLARNCIKRLDSGLFTNTNHVLNQVDLSNNSLRFLPDKLFEHQFVQQLLLAHNKIDVLTNRTFSGRTDIGGRIDLTGNPLRCDCNLRAIKQLCAYAKLLGTCSFPENFRGLRLTDVKSPYLNCDPCSLQPCSVGSLCKVTDKNETRKNEGFVCVADTIKDKCYQAPNPCLLSPCKNLGECLRNGTLGFYCRCSESYTGPNCELKLRTMEGDLRNARNISIRTAIIAFSVLLSAFIIAVLLYYNRIVYSLVKQRFSPSTKERSVVSAKEDIPLVLWEVSPELNTVYETHV